MYKVRISCTAVYIKHNKIILDTTRACVRFVRCDAMNFTVMRRLFAEIVLLREVAASNSNRTGTNEKRQKGIAEEQEDEDGEEIKAKTKDETQKFFFHLDGNEFIIFHCLAGKHWPHAMYLAPASNRHVCVCECSMFCSNSHFTRSKFYFPLLFFACAITDCAKVMLNERALHKWCMDIEVFFIVFQSFSSDRLYGFSMYPRNHASRTSVLLNFMCVFSRSYFIVVCVVTVGIIVFSCHDFLMRMNWFGVPRMSLDTLSTKCRCRGVFPKCSPHDRHRIASIVL